MILGIETSCDESSIALVANKNQPICEATASQIKRMSKYGGVVPELSARMHLEALPILYHQCQKEAPQEIKQIRKIAVTSEPGLPPALATGLAFAQGLAYAKKLPLIKVNHLHAHLISPLIEDIAPEDAPKNYSKKVDFPHVSLLVSGGHTSLFYVKSFSDFEEIGSTRDDAAGEAFDKIARIIGLGYPGGPEIQKWAQKYTPKVDEKPIFTLPVPEDGYNFSFSGLKTAARRIIIGNKPKVPKDSEIEEIGRKLLDEKKAKIAYHFQEIIVKSLVSKTIQAAQDMGVSMITLSGGVSANLRLRLKLSQESAKHGFKLKYPSFSRCTDNATMVATAAAYL